MGEKCLDHKQLIEKFIEDNIVKILLSITMGMIFVIANSRYLIMATLYGSWFLTFFGLLIIGTFFSYWLLSLVFKILK